MRRGLASLIMALSLIVATGAWAGFIMSRTVLDPGRSERLADHLLDNEDVRATVVDRLADAVEARIPSNVVVPRRTIELAAEESLDDPRVEAVIRDGIVRTHQNALNGVDEPVALDASALGQVGREKVVAARPELDSVLPQAPELEVELPASGLSWLGSVKDTVDRFTLIASAVALIGMTSAFVLARNRPAALRRVAFWAFGASAFWIAVAYAIPAVLGRVAPSSVSIASAIIDVFFGAMVRPAVVLALAGLALLLTSFIWPALSRRRPAATLDRGQARGANDLGPIPVGGPPPAGRPLGAAPGAMPVGAAGVGGVAGVGPTHARDLGPQMAPPPAYPAGAPTPAAAPVAQGPSPAGAGAPGPWVDNVQHWEHSPDPTQVWTPGVVQSRHSQPPEQEGVDPDAVTQSWEVDRQAWPPTDEPPANEGGWVAGIGYAEDEPTRPASDPY